MAPVLASGDLGNWVTAGTMSQPRVSHGAVAYGGRIYVIGGQSGFRSDIEVADILPNGMLGPFTTTTPLAVGRRFMGCAAYDGRLYALGFHGVRALRSHEPEGMMLYALIEMAAAPPSRRFVFAEWEDGGGRYLEVTAEGMKSNEVTGEGT
jgi:hypothetical protein